MKYMCRACHWIYDEIKEGVSFEELDDNWECPICGLSKKLFIEITDEEKKSNPY